MTAKPLKDKTNGNGFSATDAGPRPGDFPLGSLESRAAARSLLQHTGPGLSRVEQECLLLQAYCGVWLTFATEPPSDAVQFKPHYVHVDARTAARMDDRPTQNTLASIQFRFLHGREPASGDVLRYDDVDGHRRFWLRELEGFRALWEEYASGPFPLKLENGRIYVRRNTRLGWEEWEPDTLHSDTDSIWRAIEEEATGAARGDSQRPAKVEAVTFTGIEGNKHACRPATPEEIKTSTRAEPPNAGLLGILSRLDGGQMEARS